MDIGSCQRHGLKSVAWLLGEYIQLVKHDQLVTVDYRVQLKAVEAGVSQHSVGLKKIKSAFCCSLMGRRPKNNCDSLVDVYGESDHKRVTVHTNTLNIVVCGAPGSSLPICTKFT